MCFGHDLGKPFCAQFVFCFWVFFGTSQRFWHVVATTMQKPRVARCGGAAFHLARFIVADGRAESSAPDLF